MLDRSRVHKRVLAGFAISMTFLIVTSACGRLAPADTKANGAQINGRFVLAPFPSSKTPEYDTSRWAWVLDTQTGHLTAYQLVIGHETTPAGDRLERSKIIEVVR